MKFKSLFWSACCTLAICSGLTACSDDENDEPVVPPTGDTDVVTHTQAYILNEGAMEGNNASLGLYCPDSTHSYVADCYLAANGRQLGDLAQDLKVYGDRLYVVVSGSKYIAKLDKNGKQLAQYNFTAEQGEPRTLVPAGGDLYVTAYDGAVHRLDTASLQHTGSLMIAEGMRLEGMTECNGKLYAAIGYKVEPATEPGAWDTYIYQNRVAVIDVATFKKEKEITVGSNPSVLATVDGEVYLYSIGDYYLEGSLIQRIQPDGSVDSIAVANKMAVAGTELLLVNAVTDWTTYATTNHFARYDVVSETLSNGSFLHGADELESATIYMMASDPTTGDIYVGTTDYVSTGDIYRFNAEGNLIGKFDCGGINPSKMVFMNE